MRGRVLESEFFNRSTLTVARELLGKFLVRRIGKKIIARMITEVEAYDGFNDKASHAHRGKTARNAVMFGPARHWYVYFTYGMHWMLNSVTGPKDYPAAILIRGVEGINGPARLTKFFNIDKRFNGKPVLPETGLWVEDRGIHLPPKDVKKTSRIGVTYAGRVWTKKPYRFFFERS